MEAVGIKPDRHHLIQRRKKMKREIFVPSYWSQDEYRSRILGISDALSKLGFQGASLVENQINAVLKKLHETEEALAKAKASHPDSVRDVRVGDIVRVEGFGIIDNGGSYSASPNGLFEILSLGGNGIFKSIFLQQVDSFGKRFGSRVQFSIRNIVSIERRERRVKERRGTDAWLINAGRLDAIKALGALSPRTQAQTEVLKDLIASVRKDGSSTFRTPGKDRRKK